MGTAEFLLVICAILICTVWYLVKLVQELERISLARPTKLDLLVYKDLISRLWDRSNSISGKTEQAIIKAKIAEKLAERAFTVASSNTMGIGILQRTFAHRPIHSKSVNNFINAAQLKAFKKEDPELSDMLASVMSPEERDRWEEKYFSTEEREILEEAKQHEADMEFNVNGLSRDKR
jgi:hypothetical protein